MLIDESETSKLQGILRLSKFAFELNPFDSLKGPSETSKSVNYVQLELN